jgi:hypothetical protein
MCFTDDMLTLSSENLPGQFAVWCTSEEARFLHGRFLAAWWDVNELGAEEVRERMKSEYHFLRIGLVGVTSPM